MLMFIMVIRTSSVGGMLSIVVFPWQNSSILASLALPSSLVLL